MRGKGGEKRQENGVMRTIDTQSEIAEKQRNKFNAMKIYLYIDHFFNQFSPLFARP